LVAAVLSTFLSFQDGASVSAMFNFQRSKMKNEGGGASVPAAVIDPHDYGVDVSTQIHGRLDLNSFQVLYIMYFRFKCRRLLFRLSS
jgi:hypothetical protein